MHKRLIARAAGTALVVASAVLASGGVKAEGLSNTYARLDVGASMSSSANGDIFNGTGFGNDFGVSPTLDVGVGAVMPLSGFNLRGEFEVGYRPSFNGDHSAPNTAGTTILSTQTSVKNWTTMINAYGDFNVGSAFSPYLGAGAGLGFNKLGLLTYAFNGTTAATEPGASKTSFAWSAMAGIGYKLAAGVTLDFRYRFLDAGKVASTGAITLVNGATVTQPPVQSHLKTHELTMGVRYEF